MDGDGDVDFVTTRGNSTPYDGVLWLEQVRTGDPVPSFDRAREVDSPELESYHESRYVVGRGAPRDALVLIATARIGPGMTEWVPRRPLARPNANGPNSNRQSHAVPSKPPVPPRISASPWTSH